MKYQFDEQGMEHLSSMIKMRFPKVIAISESSQSDYFLLDLSTVSGKVDLFLSQLDAFVRDFIQSHGDQNIPYIFEVYCAGQLIGLLRYNDPNHGYHLELDIRGKREELDILEIASQVGAYTVFSRSHEKIGILYQSSPSIVGQRSNHNAQRPFEHPERWHTNSSLLRPYLNKIVLAMERLWIGQQQQLLGQNLTH